MNEELLETIVTAIEYHPIQQLEETHVAVENLVEETLEDSVLALVESKMLANEQVFYRAITGRLDEYYFPTQEVYEETPEDKFREIMRIEYPEVKPEKITRLINHFRVLFGTDERWL